MKKIIIENGEIRIGFEFKDLTPEIQEKVIHEQIDFEIEIIQNENDFYYSYAMEMEKMQTPWFLHEYIYEKDKAGIIEILEINDYLFDEDGNIIPLVHYVGKHILSGKVQYKQKYFCTIEEMEVSI